MKKIHIRKTKIEVDSQGDNILVYCPNCDNWESLGIDDPRHRLHVIPIIEWYEDKIGQNERSLNECSGCKEKFEVEWDYKNIYYGN